MTPPEGADEIADRMSRSLPGSGESARYLTETVCIAGLFKNRRDHCQDGNGVIAAVEGTPRWSKEAYRSVAQSKGNGRAIIEAYLEEGASFLNSMVGAFSLVLFDPNADKLFLAIDRMGIRPLCYSITASGGIAFGSTTASLVTLDDVPGTISRQSIFDYFFFHVVPSPRTIYTGVVKLEPGQAVEFQGGKLRKSFYWKPIPAKRSVLARRSLERELIPCLRSAVARCETGANSGTFLSGGLDSSTVSGLASELSSEPVRAYSIGFAQDGYDEVQYARLAADHFGLDLKTYYVTPEDVAESIERIGSSYDEPFGNSSAIPTYFCAKLAKSDGVESLLAGDGGDELFAGNERYAIQKLFDVYERVPGVLRKYLIEPFVLNVPMGWSKPAHKVMRYVEQARVPMPDRLQTYNYIQMHEPSQVFEKQFLDAVDVNGPIDAMREWYDRNDAVDLVDKMLFFDWKLTLADNDIRKVNTMCDLVGVDVAYPMLDSDLVELSTRVRSRDKIRGLELRTYFKHASRTLLPAQTLQKEKHGFGLPFGEWLRSSPALRSIVAENMERLKDRGIFREAFIDHVEGMHRTDHAAYYGSIVWVLVLLEVWLNARKSVVPC